VELIALVVGKRLPLIPTTITRKMGYTVVMQAFYAATLIIACVTWALNKQNKTK
jgi:hypothetical protein